MWKMRCAVKQTGRGLARLPQLSCAAQQAQQRRTGYSSATEQQLRELIDENAPERTDSKWLNAKEYSAIPGPSKYGFFLNFLPGGEFYKLNYVDMNKILRKRYGDIYLLKGIFSGPDTVFTYNAADFEVVYRNEGISPLRVAQMSFDHFRKVKRVDFFKSCSGLVTEHGRSWGDMRNKVDSVMMKSASIREDLPKIDKITLQFVDRLETLRDPITGLLKNDFYIELKKWAFESVTYIALNKRLKMSSDDANHEATKLAQNLADIRNTQYALLMGIDSLTSGIDTIASTFITTLYQVARNPEKQRTLRGELMQIMPDPQTPLNAQNTKHMPYLRACIKEALRITPIAPGNLRIVAKDVVLSGYRIPRGTSVHMGHMALCNSEKYFPRCKEFIPERWLSSAENACPELRSSNPYIYAPFGLGPRTCVGKCIAEMELETLLARLLRLYKVSWASPEDMQYISNLILSPKAPTKFRFMPLEEEDCAIGSFSL